MWISQPHRAEVETPNTLEQAHRDTFLVHDLGLLVVEHSLVPLVTNPADGPKGTSNSCHLKAADVLLALAVRELGVDLTLHGDALAASGDKVQSSFAPRRRHDLVSWHVHFGEDVVAGARVQADLQRQELRLLALCTQQLVSVDLQEIQDGPSVRVLDESCSN